jgi:hypothetical protein
MTPIPAQAQQAAGMDGIRGLEGRTYLRGGRSRRVLYSVRMFGFPELRDWLRAAGFTAVAGHGEDGQPLTADSRRMIVVGRI